MTELYEGPFRQPPARPRRAAEREAARGVGWMVFAAVILATSGTLNAIYGIAAIASSKFFAGGADYIVGSLKTLGWIVLVLGAVQLAAGLAVLAFVRWARWVGAAAAAVNAIVMLLIMPGAPFLAVALFATNMLVVYALIAHGRQWQDG